MIPLAVAVGAFIGAPARYLIDRTVSRRHGSVFPLGTLVVNVIASFVLGTVVAWAGGAHPDLVALLATGFCGGLSTYSTFSYETMRLLQGDERGHALGSVAANLVIGIGAAVLGWLLGSALR